MLNAPLEFTRPYVHVHLVPKETPTLNAEDMNASRILNDPMSLHVAMKNASTPVHVRGMLNVMHEITEVTARVYQDSLEMHMESNARQVRHTHKVA